MHSQSYAYVIESVVTLGVLGFLLSLCGLPILLLIGARSHRPDATGHYTLLDLLALVAFLGPLTALIWNLFPGADKIDASIYLAILVLLAVFWWWRVATTLSRNGIVRPLRRVAYEIVVVLFAFLAPPIAAIFTVTIVQARSVRPPAPIGGDVSVLITCIAGYLSCVPITLWVRTEPGRQR